MTTKKGQWKFVQIGTKKELLKKQKSMIGYKTRIEPFTVMVIDSMTTPARPKHTFKPEKWVE
jgi:hypothetical protein